MSPETATVRDEERWSPEVGEIFADAETSEAVENTEAAVIAGGVQTPEAEMIGVVEAEKEVMATGPIAGVVLKPRAEISAKLDRSSRLRCALARP